MNGGTVKDRILNGANGSRWRWRGWGCRGWWQIADEEDDDGYDDEVDNGGGDGGGCGPRGCSIAIRCGLLGVEMVEWWILHTASCLIRLLARNSWP